MSRSELDLSPGSRLPENPREMDLLLRRVPELALAPELRDLGFEPTLVLPDATANHAARIVELADAAYLGRLGDALEALVQRAAAESNGGLRFLAASLQHFVTALPPGRHPLVVALYFLSAKDSALAADPLELVARRMDAYEAGLAALDALDALDGLDALDDDPALPEDGSR